MKSKFALLLSGRCGNRAPFHALLIYCVVFALICGVTTILLSTFGISHLGAHPTNRRIDTEDHGVWVPQVSKSKIHFMNRRRNQTQISTRGAEKYDAEKLSPLKTSVNPTNKNRLFCMVPFIWRPSNVPAYDAIRNTWGKRCHILKFFIDPIIGDAEVGFYNLTKASEFNSARKANLTIPGDVVILHDMQRQWHTCKNGENSRKSDETCRNIWEKIWRAWVHVVYGPTGGFKRGSAGKVHEETSYAFKAEWFVKVDADTYLFPENVERFVEWKKWSHDEHHYFGNVLNHRVTDRGVSIVAGAAAFFSRATLLAAADAFRRMPMENGNLEEDGTCRDAYSGTDEVVTAVCLKQYFNVTAEPAIDSEGREEVAIFDISDILSWNRTQMGEWWYWEGKKRFPCHDEGDSLAHLPMAFHKYAPQFFYDFENEFYGNVKLAKSNNSSLFISNDGALASRNWPKFDMTYQYLQRIRLAMSAAEPTLSSKKISISSGGRHNISSEERNRPLLGSSDPTTIQRKDRLYCMVPFIWTPQLLPSYHAIRNTWGKRCDTLKFMIDPIIGDEHIGFKDLRSSSTAELPEDVVPIYDIQRPWNACQDSEEGNCRNIWEKIWRSWVWVDSHGGRDLADWFVKVDADTYLFPDNFKRYVSAKQFSPDEHHYFGHRLNHRMDDVGPIIAGAAVFFSRTTLVEAAKIFRTFSNGDTRRGLRRKRYEVCRDAHTDQEEVITAVCLKQYLNIHAEAALDDLGRELISVGKCRIGFYSLFFVPDLKCPFLDYSRRRD
ncbi:hypothetical protein ACHAXS_012300 [Conticribra weissflogii]